MIVSVQGTIVEKTPTHVVLDVGGIGYEIWITLSGFESLGRVGEQARLRTYLDVREDLHQLFGFVSEEERGLFLLLISVSGIGPKSALSILSAMPVRELRQAIVSENIDFLTAAPGVGKKTAQRLIVELKEKVMKGVSKEPLPAVTASPTDSNVADEAVMALTSLGYAKAAAEKAVVRAIQEKTDHRFTIEELVKSALRVAAGG